MLLPEPYATLLSRADEAVKAVRQCAFDARRLRAEAFGSKDEAAIRHALDCAVAVMEYASRAAEEREDARHYAWEDRPAACEATVVAVEHFARLARKRVSDISPEES